MFKNYLIIAIRNIKRQKRYAFINIFGLALGIACCILMSLFVKHEWSHDQFHKNKKQLYRVITEETRTNDQIRHISLQPHTLVETFKDDLPGIILASAYSKASSTLKYENKEFNATVGLVSPDFLSMFTFPLLSGNPSTALDQPDAIVISQALAQKIFGNQQTDNSQILGQTLIAGGLTFKIAGIFADPPKVSSLKFDVLASIQNRPHFGGNNMGDANVSIYIQLAENQKAQAFDISLKTFAQTHLKKRIDDLIKWKSIPDADAFTLRLQPLTDVYWAPYDFAYEASGNLQAVYILSGLAGLVLLIACCNFTTLSISNSTSRSREIGMRKILGANRMKVMKQFWVEALLLSLLSLIAGLALVELFLPIFNSLIQRDLHTANLIDPAFLFLLLCIVIIVGLVSGGYPAIVLSRFQPVSALKGDTYLGGRNHLIRTLIILQYTAAIALMICIGVMFKQHKFINKKSLGYEQDHVIVIWSGNKKMAQIYKQALLSQPSITSVTLADRAFTNGSSSTSCKLDDGTRIGVRLLGVDDDYLSTLQIPLLQGRNFSDDFTTDQDNAVLINESLAKKLNLENPIGYTIKGFGYDDITPTIIGVVQDFHIDSLHRTIRPLVLQMKYFNSGPYVIVRAQPQNLQKTLESLKTTWQEIAPNRRYGGHWFLNESLSSQYLNELRWQRIMTYSAGFAILISCLGLLGLASLAVSRRTKEIGIRKVLGASVPNLVNLLTLDFIKLLLIANIIAWPIAYYAMDKWLTNFAYHIELGIGIFVLSGALALGVALLTVGTQTFKAARSNPVDALRYE